MTFTCKCGQKLRIKNPPQKKLQVKCPKCGYENILNPTLKSKETVMKAIKENPFRILGVLSDSGEREIQKIQAKINAYLEVGKDVSLDNDFPFLGKISRSKESVKQALSSLEINQNRVRHALFWFLNSSHIDEPAFNYLRNGDIDKAIDIWSKATQSSEITSRNYSCCNNLGTLKIALSFKNGQLNKNDLSEGIGYKLKLLKTEGINEFAKNVTDETFKVETEELEKFFIDELLKQINSHRDESKELSFSDITTFFTDGSSSIKQYLLQRFTNEPVHNIESNVEKTKKKRHDNPTVGNKFGRELYVSTIDDLATLKEILGNTNIQYQVIADKLANEIMQCGIDYFQVCRDDTTLDPSPAVTKLFLCAQQLAEGTQTKQRIKENHKGLQEWIENKPIREKENKIKDELQFLANKLEQFQRLQVTILNAKNLILECKPKLSTIKEKLGISDYLYLDISSAVVNNAMGMVVAKVNVVQESFKTRVHFDRDEAIAELKATIKIAWEVINMMENLDMHPPLRTQYNENQDVLRKIKQNFSVVGKAKSMASGILESILGWAFFFFILFILSKACN